MNLAKTSIVQKAWKNKKSPEIHGWVYSLEDGLIKEICNMTHENHLDPLYEFDDL
jgi:carbonic anhydrase